MAPSVLCAHCGSERFGDYAGKVAKIGTFSDWVGLFNDWRKDIGVNTR